MGAMELDGTDLAIVQELRTDGRLPFETLAARVGLSRAAARLRVRRMQESGRLRVVGAVHPAVRGSDALAHVFADVHGSTSSAARAIAALPGTGSVHLTAGRRALAAEVRGGGLAELDATADRIRAVPEVAAIAVAVCTRILKDPMLAARPAPGLVPDHVDLRLLVLLERDGRRSFADLAAEVGLSAGAVRTRVIRLLDGGALRITVELDPAAAGLGRQGGFALRVDGSATADAAARDAAAWPETRFLARCLGGHDLLGTVAAATVEGLHEVFERLRSLDGVRVTETWFHLARVDPATG